MCTHNKQKRRERKLKCTDDPCRLGFVHVEGRHEGRDRREQRGVVEGVEELREAEDDKEHIAARGGVLLRDAAIDESLCRGEHGRWRGLCAGRGEHVFVGWRV